MERKRKCVKNLKYYYENLEDLYAEFDDTDSDPDFLPNDEETDVSRIERRGVNKAALELMQETALKTVSEATPEWCTDGVTPPRFSKAICFKFDSNKPFEMKLKHKMNEEFLMLNLNKRGRMSNPILHLKGNAPIKINKKKLDDVKSLLKYIPPIHHDYYNGILSAPQVEDQGEDEIIE